ncbi:hypothetical protein BH10BAC5_BH10BAC5_17070 [soil metagenome]
MKTYQIKFMTDQLLTGEPEECVRTGSCNDGVTDEQIRTGFEKAFATAERRIEVLEVNFIGEREVTACKSCKRFIIWIKTKNNKSHPINAELIECKGGEMIFTEEKNLHRAEAGERGHLTHFATC